MIKLCVGCGQKEKDTRALFFCCSRSCYLENKTKIDETLKRYKEARKNE